ncbi:Ig-like domain-containing protein, partial [Escherichia coli]|nr:Ig-like domain-containing protein [Escherichia coli]
SKNEDKATVDQSGNVTGVEVGTATIEIVSQDGSKKATATVEVTAPVVAVTAVEIDPNSTTVEANKTVQLTANVEPAGAT